MAMEGCEGNAHQLCGTQPSMAVLPREVELEGENVSGVAVQIAALLSSHAEAGQTLVSQTVRDLVVGSGIEFEEHGAAQLEGVPGEWELLAVAS